MILLSVGVAWAASLRFDAVAFGAHSGPHTNYPDCSPAFAEAMDCAAGHCDDWIISAALAHPDRFARCAAPACARPGARRRLKAGSSFMVIISILRVEEHHGGFRRFSVS
jgi:hypothetical protein